MVSIAREELVLRYRAWSAEDLLCATTADEHEYTAEARELMKEELSSRDCPAQQQRELLEAIQKENVENASKLAGVKGLLAFMVFVIAIYSASALLESVGGGSAEGSTSLAPYLLIVARWFQGIYGLVVCVLLVRKDPRAPGHAATFFLATMTISITTAFLDSYLGSGRPTLPLSILTGSALWLSYLSASKRVRATYGVAARS